LFFLSCRPFVVNTTFSTGLVGVENKGKLILNKYVFTLYAYVCVKRLDAGN
jgi:hypothetical protein